MKRRVKRNGISRMLSSKIDKKNREFIKQIKENAEEDTLNLIKYMENLPKDGIKKLEDTLRFLKRQVRGCNALKKTKRHKEFKNIDSLNAIENKHLNHIQLIESFLN